MLLWLGQWSQPQQKIYNRTCINKCPQSTMNWSKVVKQNGPQKKKKNHTVNDHFKLLHCIVILFHRTAKSHVSPFHITGDVFEPNQAMKSTTDLFFNVSSLMWPKKCWWQKQNSTHLWNCCFTKRPPNCFSAVFVFSESTVTFSTLSFQTIFTYLLSEWSKLN